MVLVVWCSLLLPVTDPSHQQNVRHSARFTFSTCLHQASSIREHLQARHQGDQALCPASRVLLNMYYVPTRALKGYHILKHRVSVHPIGDLPRDRIAEREDSHARTQARQQHRKYYLQAVGRKEDCDNRHLTQIKGVIANVGCDDGRAPVYVITCSLSTLRRSLRSVTRVKGTRGVSAPSTASRNVAGRTSN
jgi:hypothetical protein